jgi:hypothetical protein
MESVHATTDYVNATIDYVSTTIDYVGTLDYVYTSTRGMLPRADDENIPTTLPGRPHVTLTYRK